METYNIEICGIKRKLPIVYLSNDIRIAFFELLGDIELCEAVASEFIRIANSPCDYIVTPELKAIPLAHEMSRISRKPYIVFRKTNKPYMTSPLHETVQSFTSFSRAELWIDSIEAQKLKNKNIWLVDDVITTGNTLKAMENLIKRIGGIITQKFIVLKEGELAKGMNDIISLGELPVLL